MVGTPVYMPDFGGRFGGGILSGQVPQQGGVLSGMGGAFQQLLDPSVALPVAAQLIGGRTLKDSLAGAFQVAGPGIDNMQRRAAINAWLKARSGKGDLSPEMVQFIQSDPGLAEKLAIHDLAGGQASPKPPTVAEFFDEKTGLPYKATWNAQTGAWDRIGGSKAPTGWTVETGPDGQTRISQGPVNAKPTEFQGKSHVYAARMAEADKTITSLEGTGTSLMERGKAQIPVAGNYMVSADYQKLDQAERDFINAVLRQESGATIIPSEFENARKQYFPQPGDGPEVIAQKRANRRLAIEKIQENAGPAYNQPKSGEGGSKDEGGWTDLGNGVRIRAKP